MRTVRLIAILAVVTAVSVIAGDSRTVDQAKQHKTLAALCSISAAIELYSQDNGYYPRASSVTTLEREIVPFYAAAVPQRDGWGNTFEIDSLPTAYTIASCGKGATGGCTSALIGRSGKVGGEFTDPTFDIIISDGEFAAWPKDLLDAHVDSRGRCRVSDSY